MAINDYLQGINNATSGEKTDVTTATGQLSDYQAGAGSLPSKLKEALNTKLNNNRDIIDQQSETMQNYFNSGANARDKYRDVWDPIKKAKLVQEDRSMALRPYDTLSGVLENRMGSVSDIVNAGVSGWKGLVDSATTKLDTAKSTLATALQSYMSAVGQQNTEDDMNFKIAQAKESSRQFGINSEKDQQKIDNQVKQFNQELALKIKAANASGSGTAAKNAQNTAAIWTDVLTQSGGDAAKAWQIIHNNEASWGAAGIDMNTIWSGYKALGGSSSNPVADPNAGKSWFDKQYSNPNGVYDNTISPLSPYITKT
jgi:hypothetical protein